MLEIISIYIGIVFMMLGVVLFGKMILNENIKVSIFKFILLMILISLFHLFLYFYLKGTLKTIIMCFINIYLYKYLFKTSIKKNSFLTFIYMLILVILELIQLFIVTKIFCFNMDVFYDNYAGSMVGNMVISLIFIIIAYLFKDKIRKIINMSIANNTKIVIFSILTFICIGMFFYTIIKEFRFSNNVLLYLIAIIILIVVLFSLIKQTIENNKLIEKYDKLLEFMTTYENEIEKQRILRHETKNEFLAIKAKLYDKQKNKEIIDYIDEILKDKIKVNQEKYAKFGYLPANGIKGLCYFKVQEAENLGIKVSINISTKIKKSSIYNLGIKNQRDLGKLLGVFLDNAIEASNKSKKKQLGIEIYVTKNKETTITITNTFANEINKNKIGKERFTTKGKERGHGLLLANHIINKNDTFKIKTEILNEVYIQTIFIKTM